jgi:hypothetical protein
MEKVNPLSQPAAGNIAQVYLGVPTFDSDEFEEHYRKAKTGVPLTDAVDFAGFLDLVVTGKFFGSKYAKKFTDGKWLVNMTLSYQGGKRHSSMEFGETGVKVADAIYGQERGPVRSKGKMKDGLVKYENRLDGVFLNIEATIKSSS